MFRISLFALMFSSAGFAIAQSSYSFTEFSCPDSSSTHALGINDSNLIVGECRSTGLLHGFLYDGESFDTVEPPDASRSAANGINLGGVLVGSYQTPGSQFYRGFMRIDESTYKDIVPPETVGDSFARGINSLNQVAGGYLGGDGLGHGFILDGDMYIAPLDCPGWPDFGISGIDDNGRFVGTCNSSDTDVAAIYDGTTNLVGSYFDNGAIHYVGFLATPKETLRTAK